MRWSGRGKRGKELKKLKKKEKAKERQQSIEIEVLFWDCTINSTIVFLFNSIG